MGKIPGNDAVWSLNATALEDDMDDVGLNITQANPDGAGLSDVGPRRVVASYDWDMPVSGKADFLSGQSDAVVFGLLGVAAGQAVAYEPTGNVVGANDPHYDGTGVFGTMQLRSARDQAVTISATILGNSALTRAVA